MAENLEGSKQNGKESKFSIFRPRWFSTLQNYQFEIAAVRSEIAQIEKGFELSSDKKGILAECKNLLEKIDSSFGRWFPRELFVWQSLFLIRQYLLLIVPYGQLLANWRTMEKRLSQLEKEVAGRWREKIFHTAMAGRIEKNDEENDPSLRGELREIREFLDDRIVLEMVEYQASTIQCRILVCSDWSRRHAHLFRRFLRIELCLYGLHPVALSDSNDPGRLAGRILEWAIGRTVDRCGADSGSCQFDDGTTGHRGHCGVFLYFIAAVGVVEVAHPALYGAAIAFGFTERPFFKALQNVADVAKTRIGRIMH